MFGKKKKNNSATNVNNINTRIQEPLTKKEKFYETLVKLDVFSIIVLTIINVVDLIMGLSFQLFI